MTTLWPRVPLGDLLTERQEIPSTDGLASGEIRIVSKISFGDGVIQFRANGETKTNMILIQPGDLVVSGINAAKGAIAVYGEENTEPIAATIHYGAYIPNKDKVDVRFLWWFLRSNVFKDLLLEYVPGGIKTELKAKRLLPMPVPVPSLKEQGQIVTRIEELTVRITDARSLRQQATNESGALVKSVLRRIGETLPVSGKLGDVLISPPRNGWSARCDNIDGGTAVLSLSAVTGFRYRSTEFKRTSLQVSQDTHFWLKPGDVLVTRSNTLELVGHAAIYDGNPTPCIYPDLMMRLEIEEATTNPQFVWYWFQAAEFAVLTQQRLNR